MLRIVRLFKIKLKRGRGGGVRDRGATIDGSRGIYPRGLRDVQIRALASDA
jgi:hypothetical protein